MQVFNVFLYIKPKAMKLYSMLALFIFCSTMSAQAQTESYILTFRDKSNSTYSLSHPEKFLSAKAIDRRKRHGIAMTMSDMPIVDAYLKDIRSNGAQVLYTSKWLNTIVITATNAEKNRIASLPCVSNLQALHRAEVNMIKRMPEKPFFYHESVGDKGSSANLKSERSKASFDYGNAYNQINMLSGIALHEAGFQGQGMTIAVIDAGFSRVDKLHVFDSLWANHQILGTHDFVQPNHNIFDTLISAHGMMVLSTMGANLPGLIVGTAPKASYWLLRSEDAGAEYVMEEYFWVNAAEFADSAGADIINSSLGYTVFDDGLQSHTYADLNGNTTVITLGAELAAQKGILVVNSAGNSGSATDPWKYIGAPADGDSVFTIGAVDEQGKYASFSSTGPTSDGRIKPDVTAQGKGTALASLAGGVIFGNGTSFSSPIIAGMTACLWQANMSLSNMDIIHALRESASQAAAPDTLLGYGIPDYMKANAILSDIKHHGYENQNTVKIHPNPFINGFTIDFLTQPQTVLVRLKTISGHTVFEKNFFMHRGNNLHVENLPDLAAGIYILFIQSGRSNWVRKIIRQ
jgi:serine protease AprX